MFPTDPIPSATIFRLADIQRLSGLLQRTDTVTYSARATIHQDFVSTKRAFVAVIRSLETDRRLIAA